MKRYYIHKIIVYSLLCLLYLATCSACQKEPGDNEEPDEPQTGYVDRLIHGFTIKVLAQEQKLFITQAALERMNYDLEKISRLFSAAQLEIMRKNPIWMEVAIEPVEAARYHPNRQWLIDNGYIPEKAKCVEISNLANYVSWTSRNQPYMVLHELAHLYHDQALPNGFNNAAVLAAFNAAVASKKYESVRYFNGTDTIMRRAYAIENRMEYFAELSEAYFGNNDFQPFNYDELKTFDPMGYALMVEIWGKRPDKD